LRIGFSPYKLKDFDDWLYDNLDNRYTNAK
jgi:hypothetical protein